MNRYSTLNATFYLLDHIGSVVSEDQALILRSEGKLYVTSCRMPGWLAERAMGPAKGGSRYTVGFATYTGIITADSMEDAQAIAEERGWGEYVDGKLVDVVSSLAPIKSIFNLSDQSN